MTDAGFNAKRARHTMLKAMFEQMAEPVLNPDYSFIVKGDDGQDYEMGRAIGVYFKVMRNVRLDVDLGPMVDEERDWLVGFDCGWQSGICDLLGEVSGRTVIAEVDAFREGIFDDQSSDVV